MVGDKCDGINAILKKYLDKPLDGDDVCFDVVTELNSGAWLLMPAALVASVLAPLLIRAPPLSSAAAPPTLRPLPAPLAPPEPLSSPAQTHLLTLRPAPCRPLR